MTITISETELLEMPSELLLQLQQYLKTMRDKPTDKLLPDVPKSENEAPAPSNIDINSWEIPQANLKFTEQKLPGGNDYGLNIEQDGRSYFTRRWRLTPELKNIVTLAVRYGFSKVWRDGHPHPEFLDGGLKHHLGTHHIAFSQDHTQRWVFAIDVNSKPPLVEVVVFQKRYEDTLNKVLDKKLQTGETVKEDTWKAERGGGQNFFVYYSDVEKILRELRS